MIRIIAKRYAKALVQLAEEKKTIDKTTVDVNKAMQQGQSAERLNEEQK